MTTATTTASDPAELTGKITMGRSDYTEEVVNFGLTDAKQRTIGALIKRWKETVVASERTWPRDLDALAIGTVVRYVDMQAARDGKGFGASFHQVMVGAMDDPETETREAAHIERRTSTMRKRYEKQIAKGRV